MIENEELYFNPGETNIPMELNEGDMEYEADEEQEFGTGDSWRFSNRIKKDYKVILDPDNPRTVKKAPLGAKQILGVVITKPKWQKGQRPTESATNGTYARRIATVQVRANYVTTETLEPTNAAISPGDSIITGATTFDCVDKATAENTTRTLSSADANSGDKVVVAYGFYGKLKD